MLSETQETFNVCIDMGAEVSDDDVILLLEAAGDFFESSREVKALPENSDITPEQHAQNQRIDAVLTLKENLRGHNQLKKREVLSYASQRFHQLARNSVGSDT